MGAIAGEVSNQDVANMFNHVADLLELQDANPFRIRAYRNAARVVEGLGANIAAKIAAGDDLTELPGIGADLAGKVAEIVKTGQLKLVKALEATTPRGLPGLLAVPGLGPKRVRHLHAGLGVATVEDLRRAIAEGRVAGLPGFGAKTTAKIAAALAGRPEAFGTGRILWARADGAARMLAAHLRGADGLTRVTLAGSYRRKAETVGDLDIVATAPKAMPVIRRLLSAPGVTDVLAQGPTRAAVRLKDGLQVDLRVVPDASYGAALHYLTGSKAHNVKLRAAAAKRGLKVNEYGVFKGDRRVAGASEESVYASLGLPFIPPELRENRGELEAAANGTLPRLVERSDVRGDLHVHTVATDGTAHVAQMADAAREAGLTYVAVADHTRNLRVAHGQDARRLRRQLDEIDRLNARLRGITVLKSAEVDILEDGRLDLPRGVLADLDFAVCAVHSAFDLPAVKQTERVMRAMDDPACAVFAHPTCRLIGERAALNVDVDRLLVAARERNVILEINGQPERLDLSDIHARRAKDIGVRLAVTSDAHAPAQFAYLDYAVAQARRGWLEARDIVNTRPLVQLKRMLRRG